MSVPDPAGIRARAMAWLDDDPDPATRAEIRAMLLAGDDHALHDRFAHRLEFGTAGVRGALGAGPARMNRALVRRVAAGLARYLLDEVADASRRGVVVGRDARHGSDEFAHDVVSVLTGAGIACHVWHEPLPTPLTAWAVLYLGAAAGVMVTASHNPPEDNGIKVYAGDGAQIIPPVDAHISARIDAVTALDGVPLGDPTGPLVHPLTTADVDRYLAAVRVLSHHPGARDIRLAYTPMHGVGAGVALRLLETAGFHEPAVVAAQAAPDPEFPTVRFPNPEEPGALDLLFAEAERVGAAIALANDPDADRLAVAVPGADGWRALTGDEVGCLLADHLLSEPGDGRERVVATTVVSSTLLHRIAADHGATSATTLTGFKWIVRPGLLRPHAVAVLGYEEALGYAVGEVVRDKDGLSAALVVAELAALEAARGRTLIDRLDDLARRHGLHATGQWSVRLEGPDGPDRMAAAVDGIRRHPPGQVAGRRVLRTVDLADPGSLPPGFLEPPDHPPTDAVILELEGGRIVVRPSGTEPKLKCYLEVVLPVGPHGDVAAVRERAAAALAELRAGAAALTGL